MKIFKAQKGFTLVETLVAIGILSLSILATFTAVQNGLSSSGYVKDQITAYYLAQEAMEYIKNIRDENSLKNLSSTTHWLHGLSEFSTDPCWYGDISQPRQTCMIDSTFTSVSNAVQVCGLNFNSCPNLTQNTSSGLFGYTSASGWATTNFKREIQFSSIATNEVLVTIRVSWTTKGSTKVFQVSQLLFNRQD